jgi:hypothetical protein
MGSSIIIGKLMVVWTLFVVFVSYYVLGPLAERRNDMEERSRANDFVPKGGGLVKDLAAYALLRVSTGASSHEKDYRELEGFHTTDPSEFDLTSKHFCENYYFWAGDDETFSYTIRLSFTENHGSVIISWFTFAIDGVDWSLPQNYDAISKRSSDTKTESIAPGIGHLRFDVIDPGREWSIRYDGKVVSGSETRLAKAHFRVRLEKENVFFYREDWDLMSVARAMSSKSWASLSFWNDLRSQRQHRYSSRAKVTGTLEMKENENHHTLWKRDDISTFGSRDHNWGIRDWSFIRRYIWFPPLTFRNALIIDGVKYTHMTGTFVNYGTTFANFVAGAIISDDGVKIPFASSTPMKKIAPQWYMGDDEASGTSSKGLGKRTVPSSMSFSILLSRESCVLNISVQRGQSFDLWDHSFYFQSETFEIHEAQTRWNLKLKCDDNNDALKTTHAMGLLEFGANLRRSGE